MNSRYSKRSHDYQGRILWGTPCDPCTRMKTRTKNLKRYKFGTKSTKKLEKEKKTYE